MSNDHLNPIFKNILDSYKQIGARPVKPVVPSVTVDCYVCGGTGCGNMGTCQQCHGTGLLWTNGGGR